MARFLILYPQVGCNTRMDFGGTAVINGDLLLETGKVPILDPREGSYLKCLLSLY
jgi:hypothetical protein